MSAIDSAIRTVIARLDMISGAPTQAFDPSNSPGCKDPGGQRPPGEGFTEGHYFRDRLDALERGLPLLVVDTYDRLLADAEARLAQLTGRDGEPPMHHDAELDTADGVAAAVIDEAPGNPAEYVARKLGLTVFMVRRIYVGEGIDPHDGSSVSTERDERVRRAREMAGRGMSERQIRDLLGWTSTTQVRRALGRAA